MVAFGYRSDHIDLSVLMASLSTTLRLSQPRPNVIPQVDVRIIMETVYDVLEIIISSLESDVSSIADPANLRHDVLAFLNRAVRDFATEVVRHYVTNNGNIMDIMSILCSHTNAWHNSISRIVEDRR